MDDEVIIRRSLDMEKRDEEGEPNTNIGNVGLKEAIHDNPPL